jgi:hypothetical protein
MGRDRPARGSGHCLHRIERRGTVLLVLDADLDLRHGTPYAAPAPNSPGKALTAAASPAVAAEPARAPLTALSATSSPAKRNGLGFDLARWRTDSLQCKLPGPCGLQQSCAWCILKRTGADLSRCKRNEPTSAKPFGARPCDYRGRLPTHFFLGFRSRNDGLAQVRVVGADRNP